jgi:hypothetical protein
MEESSKHGVLELDSRAALRHSELLTSGNSHRKHVPMLPLFFLTDICFEGEVGEVKFLSKKGLETNTSKYRLYSFLLMRCILKTVLSGSQYQFLPNTKAAAL